MSELVVNSSLRDSRTKHTEADMCSTAVANLGDSSLS